MPPECPSWRPTPGARTRRPPTTEPSRSSSPTPEAAAVGLSLAEAERAGLRVRAVDVDMSSVAGAGLYADGYRGRAHMVVDINREILVGLTLVGPGVGELIHSATIAIAGEVPIQPPVARGPVVPDGERSVGCGCWRCTGTRSRSRSPGYGRL